jgi:holin-like protein
MIKDFTALALQFLLLWVLFQIGTWFSETTGLAVPGNVIGLILLLTLLITRVIPISWVDRGAGLFVKHLGFFFIPICVGVLAVGTLSPQLAFSLTVILLLSTLAGIAVTGKIFQSITERKELENDRSST